MRDHRTKKCYSNFLYFSFLMGFQNKYKFVCGGHFKSNIPLRCPNQIYSLPVTFPTVTTYYTFSRVSFQLQLALLFMIFLNLFDTLNGPMVSSFSDNLSDCRTITVTVPHSDRPLSRLSFNCHYHPSCH